MLNNVSEGCLSCSGIWLYIQVTYKLVVKSTLLYLFSDKCYRYCSHIFFHSVVQDTAYQIYREVALFSTCCDRSCIDFARSVIHQHHLAAINIIWIAFISEDYCRYAVTVCQRMRLINDQMLEISNHWTYILCCLLGKMYYIDFLYIATLMQINQY